MSYRHSSYRKMGAAITKANGGNALTRPEIGRVMHWSNLAILPKPFAWGKPKGWRVHT